jgi:hypothetical protein
MHVGSSVLAILNQIGLFPTKGGKNLQVLRLFNSVLLMFFVQCCLLIVAATHGQVPLAVP